jgi:TPR repeat protein
MRKRVEAKDPASTFLMADNYFYGKVGFQQNCTKAIELWNQAADLGYSKAHSHLANYYHGVDMKKAKFHNEAAAMAGDEVAKGAILETWRKSPEILNALLSIGQLQHLLGIMLPCIS